MTTFRLHFLGTSAARPTARRGLSATLVQAASERLLIDCGEGTQRQLITFGLGLRVNRIFITHLHADHYLGVAGLLRTLKLMEYDSPIEIYGPAAGVEGLLRPMLALVVGNLGFKVECHGLASGDVVTAAGYEVLAFAVEHRVEAFGYAVRETGVRGRFLPDAAEKLGIPKPLYGRLQRGESVTVAGREILPSQVLGPPRRARSLVFSGDTLPSAAVIAAARDADVLVHEATFCDAEQDHALETFHSTAREAGRVAREAGARSLLLNHISSRYENVSRLLEETRSEFAGEVRVAEDSLAVDVTTS